MISTATALSLRDGVLRWAVALDAKSLESRPVTKAFRTFTLQLRSENGDKTDVVELRRAVAAHKEANAHLATGHQDPQEWQQKMINAIHDEAVAAGEEGATAGAADTSFGSPAEARAGAPRSSLLNLLQFVEQAEDRCRSCGEVLHMHCVNSTSIVLTRAAATATVSASAWTPADNAWHSLPHSVSTSTMASASSSEGPSLSLNERSATDRAFPKLRVPVAHAATPVCPCAASGAVGTGSIRLRPAR